MSNASKTYRFILSGGGTGGHIYPAIAIANELKNRFPESDFLFVGAKNRMEMEKVPKAGYKIEGLWISGIQRKFTLKNILFPLKLVSSLIKSKAIIRQFKPDVVIGTGGFASGPVLHVANSKGIPTLIQEQNSFPGITNKILGKKANVICVAYEGLERFFPASKLKLTGNPVRKDLVFREDQQVIAKDKLELSHDKYCILILGGSLGARKMNELVQSKLDFFAANKVEILWQCGSLYYNEFRKYNARDGVTVFAYIDDMHTVYAAADMIISRSGASSVSELCLVGKPVIFIPSPNVAEDHQTKNADAIVKRKAALMIAESKLNEEFDPVFLGLISSKESQETLSVNIKELAKKNATDDIVDEIEKLMKLQ